MTEKAKEWGKWLVARRNDGYHYKGFSFAAGDCALNAFRTEQSATGHVYVVACPERNVPLGMSISRRAKYSPRPGTREAVGCWSYYEDLPYVKTIMRNRGWL